MNIDDILDKLDDAIEEAWTLPLSKGRRVVDADKIGDLIDDIRLNLPVEIKQARAIVSDRGEIIDGAKKEAGNIVAKTKDKASVLVMESEILREAQKRANEIIDSAKKYSLEIAEAAKKNSNEIMETAKKNSKEIKQLSSQYSEKVLKSTEEQMVKNITEVRQVLNELKKY